MSLFVFSLIHISFSLEVYRLKPSLDENYTYEFIDTTKKTFMIFNNFESGLVYTSDTISKRKIILDPSEDHFGFYFWKYESNITVSPSQINNEFQVSILTTVGNECDDLLITNGNKDLSFSFHKQTSHHVLSKGHSFCVWYHSLDNFSTEYVSSFPYGSSSNISLYVDNELIYNFIPPQTTTTENLQNPSNFTGSDAIFKLDVSNDELGSFMWNLLLKQKNPIEESLACIINTKKDKLKPLFKNNLQFFQAPELQDSFGQYQLDHFKQVPQTIFDSILDLFMTMNLTYFVIFLIIVILTFLTGLAIYYNTVGKAPDDISRYKHKKSNALSCSSDYDQPFLVEKVDTSNYVYI